jgi:1-acyl-sn-glycerol-3-phosphate acyltransferase
VFAWVVVGITTVVFGVLAVVTAPLPPKGEWFRRLSRGWSGIIFFTSGVSVEVLHAERLVPGRSFVIAANHESFYDIPVLFSVLPMTLRFLAKRNLFRMPFLGWSMAAAGFVPVDRGDRAHSREVVDASLRRLQGGGSLVVFPEETRSRTGDLLPFKSGAALFALKSGLPLLPIGMSGTFRILRRGGFFVTPSRVVVAIGEPIEVAGRSTRERAAVTEALRERIAALRDEAREADIRSRAEER